MPSYDKEKGKHQFFNSNVPKIDPLSCRDNVQFCKKTTDLLLIYWQSAKISFWCPFLLETYCKKPLGVSLNPPLGGPGLSWGLNESKLIIKILAWPSNLHNNNSLLINSPFPPPSPPVWNNKEDLTFMATPQLVQTCFNYVNNNDLWPNDICGLPILSGHLQKTTFLPVNSNLEVWYPVNSSAKFDGLYILYLN